MVKDDRSAIGAIVSANDFAARLDSDKRAVIKSNLFIQSLAENVKTLPAIFEIEIALENIVDTLVLLDRRDTSQLVFVSDRNGIKLIIAVGKPGALVSVLKVNTCPVGVLVALLEKHHEVFCASSCIPPVVIRVRSEFHVHPELVIVVEHAKNAIYIVIHDAGYEPSVDVLLLLMAWVQEHIVKFGVDWICRSETHLFSNLRLIIRF